MTADTVDLWIKAAGFALSVMAIVFAWVRTRNQVVHERIEKLTAGAEVSREAIRDRLDRHEGRIQSVEQTVRAMPGKEDMHALQLELAKVAGAMGTMSAVMEGNQQIMRRLEIVVNRHEKYLLQERSGR